MTNRIPITLTKPEKLTLARLARSAGLSFSNYVRNRLGLPLLRHGGARKKKPTEPNGAAQ